MLTDLKPQPADKILALMEMFRADPRENKVDLGVGVYKNAEGVTPVMRAVKAAERRIVETQETKAYTPSMLIAEDEQEIVAWKRLSSRQMKKISFSGVERRNVPSTPNGNNSKIRGQALCSFQP